MIIFGSRATHLHTEQTNEIVCSHCKEQRKHSISIFGRYAHIFWIPFFPIGKKGVSECNHCKRTLASNEMSEPLKSAYQKIYSSTKVPFWHWIGLILIGLLFILPIVITVITSAFQ